MHPLRSQHLACAAMSVLTLVLVNACSDPSAVSNPIRPVSNILYLGNSLTLHAPSETVDWSGNWGMAASAAGADYAHQLSARFPGAAHSELNIAEFERSYRTFDVTSLQAPLRSRPDLIVVELGDNVLDGSEFGSYYTALIDYLGTERNVFILCASTWWNNQTINAAIRSACTRANARYVDISGLYADALNRAAAERSFRNSGVGEHPGDRGMSAIADALYGALKR